MPQNILLAASGQQSAVGDLDDQQPNSYSSGGFSVRSSLGRVDEASVSGQQEGQEARVTATGSGDRANYVNVQLYSQGSGNQLQADTDISGDTYILRSERL